MVAGDSPFARIPALFERSPWRMSLGERAALIGIVGEMRPRLALEIGTLEGGSLAALAPHCEEIHSFDLNPPTLEGLADRPGVVIHTGDSHELVPRVLAEFADAGRKLDLALVDGDHSAAGVRADIEALLASPAVDRTVILAHDATNGEVRAGLEAIDFDSHPKVDFVDFDFLPGFVIRSGEFQDEMWGGFGLIVVDAARGSDGSPFRANHHPTFELISESWHRRMTGGAGPVSTREVAELGTRIPALEVRVATLEGELEGHRKLSAQAQARAARAEAQAARAEAEAARAAEAQRLLDSVTSSRSWRLTAPLRALKRRARG